VQEVTQRRCSRCKRQQPNRCTTHDGRNASRQRQSQVQAAGGGARQAARGGTQARGGRNGSRHARHRRWQHPQQAEVRDGKGGRVKRGALAAAGAEAVPKRSVRQDGVAMFAEPSKRRQKRQVRVHREVRGGEEQAAAPAAA